MKTVKAIHVNNADNCVTLTGDADAGDLVCFLESGAEKTVAARGHVPIWHKMAIRPVEKGAGVFKYGAVIGEALEPIGAGDHVHIHNMRSPG